MSVISWKMSRVVKVWAVLTLFSVAGAVAARPAMGKVIPQRKLVDINKKKQALLGTKMPTALLFFTPGQAFSEKAAVAVVAVRKELAKKKLHWVAVVSSRHDIKVVRAAVTKMGLEMPVLVDAKDKVYGEFGVAVRPTVAITDKTNKVVAWQPFRKIMFKAKLKAQLQYVLGEISKADLDKVLRPPPKTKVDPKVRKAKRLYKMAKMALGAKMYDKAESAIRKSLKIDEKAAASHALLGRIFEVQGKCKLAIPPFDKALELDPKEPTALAGKKACSK